jgi:hypothetical protein
VASARITSIPTNEPPNRNALNFGTSGSPADRSSRHGRASVAALSGMSARSSLRFRGHDEPPLLMRDAQYQDGTSRGSRITTAVSEDRSAA